MTKKTLLGTALLVAFTAPGLAQTTASDFYIVQDASTKRCTIVDKKPTTTTTTVVGDACTKRGRKPSRR